MRRFPFFATILTVIGVGVLCTLGFWQVQRLEWKEQILERLEAEYKEQPQRYAVRFPSAEDEDFIVSHGYLRGRYQHGDHILVGPRTLDGKAGQHFYTVFRLRNGASVFVNRGWVPADFSLLVEDRRRGALRKITGLLKPPPRPNLFTPDNDVEGGQWYHPDVTEMAAALGIKSKVSPYIFVLEDDGARAGYPRSVAAEIWPNNNHLLYAIFWFVMAGVLVAVYTARFVLKQA